MVFYVNLIPGAIVLATIFFTIDPEPLNMPLLWEGDWLGTVFMAIGLVRSSRFWRKDKMTIGLPAFSSNAVLRSR
jgi:hypothetical protein